MYQLRNLINRTSVPTDPQANMNSAEDFLLLLLHAHCVAAAKTILDYNPMDSAIHLADAIVVNYVQLPSATLRSTHNQSPVCKDRVHLYAMDLLSLSLIWHGFHDAIREGDGERILRYWKILVVVFKSSNKHNYAKEGINLLVQYYYRLSDKQRQQLLWSRCLNTRGYQGCNIACDLHMEHLNRRLKTMMRNLGANIKPKSVKLAGRCINAVHHDCVPSI